MVHFIRLIKSQRVFSRWTSRNRRTNELVDSEVDGLVKIGRKFDCPVEGLKNGT
jgi:hypothetical protein